jgi:hypothetical protein
MGDVFKTLFNISAAPLFLVLGFLLFFYLLRIINIDPNPVFSVMVALTPIWLPFVLFYLTFDKWMYYVQNKFAANNGRTTLRVHLPQEVFKSPEAMEAVLSQMHQTNGPDNLYQTYVDGKSPLTASFELVSIGGEVRFYMNVPTKKVKNSLEAALYAQYPGIEVVEEEIDYTAEVRWDPEKYEYMVFHMGKKDADVLPIKTYIDYGLDKIAKEEEKFEPMAAMLEALGKIKTHERLWIQILCVPHTKKNFKTGSLTDEPSWEKAGIAKINEMLKRTPGGIDPETMERAPMLTMGERDTIAAIERNIGKYAYETAIRWIYVTEKGKFNGDTLSPLIRAFAQYDIIGRNGVGIRWRSDFDMNFFQDRSGKKKMKWKEFELGKYKDRSYYYQDRKGKADAPKVFSVEELATMFHIPGSGIVTPGVSRITSARKEAPSNLPTGLNLPI